MTNIKFLEPENWVEDIDVNHPRTSLDFIIRQNGEALDSRTIRIQSLQAQEQIGQLFEYHVDFRANDQAKENLYREEDSQTTLSFKNIIGCSATVRIGLPGPDSYPSTGPDPAYTVFFNGIVSQISLKEAGVYRCILRPALWKLSLVNNYQCFSQMTIKDVIQDIVKKKWGLSCDTEGLGSLATYRTQDWMQMGESDWDFIQRLLHEVGAYYYFIHDDFDHKVVFSNNPERVVSYINLPPAGTTDNESPLSVYYTFTEQESLSEDDYLKSFSYEQSLVAPNTCNVLAQPESVWEQDSPANLHVYTTGDTSGDENEHQLYRYRLFQFGTTQDLTTKLNKQDSWTLESQAFRLSGECTSPKFKPGYVFQTRQSKFSCNRNDVCLMRPELDEQRFVILSVNHQVGVDGSYSNSFTAALADGNVKELSAHDTHAGSMLGTVVSNDQQLIDYRDHWMLNKGKPNFELDEKTFSSDGGSELIAKGVHVHFPGLNVSDKPVWIKLSESMTTIPEIGVTVMVDCSRDNTNVPQISQIIEQKGNKNIMPNSTRLMTSIGDDYSTNYGDHRSISYGKNSIPNLDIAISTIDDEYGSGDFKSSSYSIGGSYSYATTDNGKSGTLSKSYSEGNSYSESYSDETDHHSEVGKSTGYSKVGTSYNESYVDKSESHSNVGSSKDYSNIVSSTHESTVGTSTSTSSVGTSTNISTVGVSTNSSATGAINSNSATGVSQSNQVTGVNQSNNIAGATNSISATGASLDLSAVGASMRITSGGASSDISSFGTSMQISAVGGVVRSVSENGIQANLQGGLTESGISGFSADIISILKLSM